MNNDQYLEKAYKAAYLMIPIESEASLCAKVAISSVRDYVKRQEDRRKKIAIKMKGSRLTDEDIVNPVAFAQSILKSNSQLSHHIRKHIDKEKPRIAAILEQLSQNRFKGRIEIKRMEDTLRGDIVSTLNYLLTREEFRKHINTEQKWYQKLKHRLKQTLENTLKARIVAPDNYQGLEETEETKERIRLNRLILDKEFGEFLVNNNCGNKAILTTLQVLQLMVYTQLKYFELENESKGYATKEDMWRRYFKFLVKCAYEQNSQHASIIFAKLIYNYGTKKSIELHEMLLQEDINEEESSHYSALNRTIMNKVYKDVNPTQSEHKARFGLYHRLTEYKDSNGNQSFFPEPFCEKDVQMIMKLLKLLALWDVSISLPTKEQLTREDIITALGLTSKGTQMNPDLSLEQRRLYGVSDPDVFAKLAQVLGFSTPIPSIPKMVPVFNANYDPNRGDPFNPPPLSNKRKNSILRELDIIDKSREKGAKSFISIRVDKVEQIRLDSNIQASASFRVSENSDLLEIFTKCDALPSGELLLACDLLKIGFENGSKSFALSLGGSLSFEIVYLEKEGQFDIEFLYEPMPKRKKWFGFYKYSFFYQMAIIVAICTVFIMYNLYTHFAPIDNRKANSLLPTPNTTDPRINNDNPAPVPKKTEAPILRDMAIQQEDPHAMPVKKKNRTTKNMLNEVVKQVTKSSEPLPTKEKANTKNYDIPVRMGTDQNPGSTQVRRNYIFCLWLDKQLNGFEKTFCRKIISNGFDCEEEDLANTILTISVREEPSGQISLDLFLFDKKTKEPVGFGKQTVQGNSLIDAVNKAIEILP